jgi:uncharacterized membrane protein YjgN (DUF898 family)
MDQTPPTPGSDTPAAAPETQAVFDGSRWPLFRLLAVNLLLTVVTIGIYRFWAKTRVRRFFWRHTRLLGDPLEYVGTGSELFVGFLIAVVVLVPIGGIYSLLQFFTLGTPGYLPLALDIVYYTLILFLIQVAIHRMRRYRLTRTAWRGVRFGLDGSSLRYALISFGYGLLSAATLWLAYPWLRVATMRYFFTHARFGDTSMTLDASARWLFRRWLVVAIPFGIATALLVVLNWSAIGEITALNQRAAEGQDVGNDLLQIWTTVVWWPALLFVAGSLVQVWYQVVEFRYLLSNVRVGGSGLRSEIGAGFVYGVYFLFWFLFFALGAALVGGAVALAPEPGDPKAIPAVAAGASVLGFFLLLALAGILRTVLVDVTLLKRVCATLSISNPEALERVVQSSAKLPSHGEGLADALDVGGF